MSLADWTSNRWATVFADDAEKLLGKTSDEIGHMHENDSEALNAFLQSQHFKSHMFKLRTKVETYGDSQRNKISVQSAAPLNHKEYNDYLIKNIQRLTGIGKH